MHLLFFTLVADAAEPSLPDLDAERLAYDAWGWAYDSSDLPDFSGDPGYTVDDPDIHGDTEGDDLWTYIHMWERTGEQGYLDRAEAWRRYQVEDYYACVGGSYSDFCYDRNAFGACHMVGPGLVTWYERFGDTEALDAAIELAEVALDFRDLSTPDGANYTCYWDEDCITYGPRGTGRHLNLLTRVAEATGDPRYWDQVNTTTDYLMESPYWDDRGMYFVGEWSTDSQLGAGAYANGDRLQSPFEIGVLAEAFYQVYRTTGRADVADKLVAMAYYIQEYGLDPTYQYIGYRFGWVDGQPWHADSAEEPVTSWDGVYTTDVVGVLALGYRLTCDPSLYDSAVYFFNRGTKSIYGEPVERSSPDDEVDHFVDTLFDTSHGNFYLSDNKGELQYVYHLFEEGCGESWSAGDPYTPTIDNLPPSAPGRLRIM